MEGRGAFGERKGSGGDAAESLFNLVVVHHAALEPGDLGFGVFPKRGHFLAQFGGETLVAAIQVAVERALPVGQPGADFVFEAVDRRLSGFGRFDGGHLLDLCGEALDFSALLEGALFGVLAAGFGKALEAVLQGFQTGFAMAQAVLPRGGHGALSGRGFKEGDAMLELFEMATDDDFPNTFDRLGRIEG